MRGRLETRAAYSLAGDASAGDLDMHDGRKRIEELRRAFQDGIDGIEEKGGAQLERFLELGSQEISELRDEIDRKRRRSRGGRSLRKSKSHALGHRRRRGRKNDDRDPAEIERARVVRRARKRANQRIGFLTHFGTFLGTLGILFVTTRSLRVILIVALSWGIGVFIHYLWAIVAPNLRDRWVSDEVGERSPPAIATERARVETRSRRSMEDLSASIAHEIRNPITAAKSLVQQMGEDPSSRENIEYADVALAELDRVERSISHLLRYARDEEPRFEPVLVREIVEAAVEGLRSRAQSEGVRLELDFGVDGAIRGDREKLRRVLENLITNALDSFQPRAGNAAAGSPDGSTRAGHDPELRIEILGGENLAGTEVWVRVIDNGMGVSEADRERIWSPFYTTKESGTGLGLALSRKTVEAHGGRIELVSGRDAGSEFVLSFPKDAGSGPSARQEDSDVF